jgi:membrane associated rhomboid family serine protease
MAWQDRPYYRDEGAFPIKLGFTPPTPVSLAIIAACIAAFALDAFTDRQLTHWGRLTFANGLAFIHPWRWITYQYLHAGSGHIFFNLLGIYFFLPPLERLWGSRVAFLFYTLGGIAAGACFGLISLLAPIDPGLVGASGSILACLGACAVLFPEKQVLLIIIPVPIRALAVLLALLYTLTIIGERNLSNAAHLGGLAFGVVAPLYGGPLFSRLQKRLHRAAVQRQVNQERSDEELVDRILQKVHDTGMNSLSRWERKALKKATERQRLAEVARARKGF